MTSTRVTPEMRHKARSLRHAMTRAETMLWSELRDLKAEGLKFRKQAPIGPYIVDFVCLAKKLVVEIDGDTHERSDRLRHDRNRDDYLRSLGYEVMRIDEPDVRVNPWQVGQEIAGRCRLLSADPTRPDAKASVHPPLKGEGARTSSTPAPDQEEPNHAR